MTKEQATAKENSFADTSQITWSKNAVIKAIQKGLMSGYPNNTFAPKASITRAEVAQVIANILDALKETSDKQVTIPDVPSNSWYAEAVRKVVASEIFTGDKKGNFNPKRNITRAELFVAIAKLLKLEPMSEERAKQVLSNYTDTNTIPSWAIGYVAVLVDEEIVSGSNGQLYVNSALTREQLATIFDNIVE